MKNKRILSVIGIMLLFLISVSLSAQVNINEKDSFRPKPLSIQFVPTSFFTPKDHTSYNLVLGVLGADSFAVKGAAISSIFHIAYDEVDGVQASGVFNIAAKGVKGWQGAGVANFYGGDIKGAQTAGVLNIARSIDGWQAAGVLNFLGRKDSVGAQTAGVMNIALGDIKGPQISGVLNYSRSASAQIGVLNIAVGEVKGPQIGIVNISKNTPAAIGLINIVAQGPTHLLVWADELMSYNVALKHGSKYIYNIYSAGTDNSGSFIYNFGLGGHIPLNRYFLDLEVMAGSILDINNGYRSGGNILSRMRVVVGIPVFRRLSIVGGVSYNMYNHFGDDSGPLDKLYSYEFPWSTDNARQWPGVFLGIQI